MQAGLSTHPEFAAFGPKLIWAELADGDGALLVRFENRPPQGTPNVWEFQNAVVKTYRRLAGEESGGNCGGN